MQVQEYLTDPGKDNPLNRKQNPRKFMNHMTDVKHMKMKIKTVNDGKPFTQAFFIDLDSIPILIHPLH